MSLALNNWAQNNRWKPGKSFLWWWWLLALLYWVCENERLCAMKHSTSMHWVLSPVILKPKDLQSQIGATRTHPHSYRVFTVNVLNFKGVMKVSCILRHWGVQLILAYSWARPAILAAGKGRGGIFLFLLFRHFHSCSSFFPVPLFYLLYYLFYLFSPFLWETTQNDPQGWHEQIFPF